MRFFQADGGEEIGCAQVLQVDLCTLNGTGTLMEPAQLDIEVFHQRHPGEEMASGRQTEGLGHPTEGFEQGILGHGLETENCTFTNL